jgi:hypothetical protein
MIKPGANHSHRHDNQSRIQHVFPNLAAPFRFDAGNQQGRHYPQRNHDAIPVNG